MRSSPSSVTPSGRLRLGGGIVVVVGVVAVLAEGEAGLVLLVIESVVPESEEVSISDIRALSPSSPCPDLSIRTRLVGGALVDRLVDGFEVVCFSRRWISSAPLRSTI